MVTWMFSHVFIQRNVNWCLILEGNFVVYIRTFIMSVTGFWHTNASLRLILNESGMQKLMYKYSHWSLLLEIIFGSSVQVNCGYSIDEVTLENCVDEDFLNELGNP